MKFDTVLTCSGQCISVLRWWKITECSWERGVELQAACMTRQCPSQCLIALHHYLMELQTTHQCQFDSVKVFACPSFPCPAGLDKLSSVFFSHVEPDEWYQRAPVSHQLPRATYSIHDFSIVCLSLFQVCPSFFLWIIIVLSILDRLFSTIICVCMVEKGMHQSVLVCNVL